MARIFFTSFLASFLVSCVVMFTVNATASPQSTPLAGSAAVVYVGAFSSTVERMPEPHEPLDETPITPVESAGAAMWP